MACWRFGLPATGQRRIEAVTGPGDAGCEHDRDANVWGVDRLSAPTPSAQIHAVSASPEGVVVAVTGRAAVFLQKCDYEH